MARLIYVPVMHSSAEMGSAASAYKAAFVARFGELRRVNLDEGRASIWMRKCRRMRDGRRA